MTYIEISRHLAVQKEYVIDIMENYTERDISEIKAIIEGTVDLLKREGYGNIEIELLMKDICDVLGWEIRVFDDMETRGSA